MKITLLTGKIFDIQNVLGFEIKVTKSLRAKKLTLRIDTQNRMPVLTVPRFCSTKRALEFVKSHQGWIYASLAKIPQACNFEAGNKFSLFGKIYEVKHNPDLRGGVFIQNEFIMVSGSPEFLNRRVKDFIKQYAKDNFTTLSHQIATKIDCKVHNICIKDTKSRWGSCSSRSNINYNWRIALAPEFVIEYLVAHEVSHLKHQDHSADFWNCVKNLCPQFKEGRDWLQKHGKDLYLYE